MGGTFSGRQGRKDPIDRLERSHRKLEEHLVSLVGLAELFDPGDASTLEQLDEVIEFLQESVLRHEEDEEKSFFPRLREHPALRPLLTRLVGEHRSERKLVAELVELRQRLDEPKAGKELARLGKALRTLCLDHIKLEDHELLPAARRYLDAAAISEIAHEMDSRRGR